MADIRLKTAKYTIAGREYTLTCNMNVLADVQEAHGGNLISALNKVRGIGTALEFGAAMCNDCADANGWDERYTAKSLGRILPAGEMQRFVDVVGDLIYSAICPVEDATEDAGHAENSTSKN